MKENEKKLEEDFFNFMDKFKQNFDNYLIKKYGKSIVEKESKRIKCVISRGILSP